MDAEGRTEPRPARWWRRWPGGVAAALVTLIVLPAVLVAWLAFTEAGLQFLWGWAGSAAQDAGVRVARVSGRLSDRVTLTDVRLDAGADAPTITLRGLVVEPAWAALLTGRMRLLAVHAEGLHVVLVDAPSEPFDIDRLPVPAWPELALPIPVEIDALHLRDVQVLDGADALFAGDASASLRADATGIAVTGLRIDAGDIALEGAAKLPWAPTGALNMQLAWRAGGELAGDLRLAGTPATIELTQTLTSPFRVVLAGRLEPRFALAADATASPWNPAFDLRLGWAEPVGLAGSTFAAVWPEALASWVAGEGQASLAGELRAHQIRVDTALRDAGGDTITLHLNASGDGHALRVAALELAAGEARLAAQGEVDWRDGFAADMQVALSALDPSRWAVDWPGRIDAGLRLTAKLPASAAEGQGPSVRARIDALSGVLRGAPLAGRGELAWADDRLDVDAFDVSSGGNALRLSGNVIGLDTQPTLDLRGELALPEPGNLLPGARGTLRADFDARGRWPAPRLDVRATAEAWQWPAEDMAIDHLVAQLTMTPDANRATSSAEIRDGVLSGDIDARGVRVAGHELSAVGARLRGSLPRHRLDMDMTLSTAAEGLHATAAAEGGWDAAAKGWRGRVEQLDVTGPGLGRWGLREPAALRVAEAGVTLAPACLAQQASRVCASADWTETAGHRARLQVVGLSSRRVIDALDALADVALPAGIAAIETTVDAEARLAGGRIDAEVQPARGVLRWRDPPLDLPETLPFALQTASFHSDARGAELTFALDLDGQAGVTAGLKLGASDESLAGRVDLVSEDLAWLGAMVPQVRELRGDLRMGATLAGRRDRPVVRAEGRLRVDRAELPELGTSLAGVELRLASNAAGDVIAVDGEATLLAPPDADLAATSGQWRVRGEMTADAASLRLNLSGESAPVLRLADLRVDVQPELSFERKAGRQSLVGSVTVPSLAYRVAELPESGLQVSPDEVIVGAAAPAPPAGPVDDAPARANLDADVTVRLGDDVRVDAFDLQARLTGRVRVLADKGGERAEGRIDIHEGSYKAYGQKLTLSRGHLLFAGPPDNPSLDLRAERLSSDQSVTAYLDVNGTARAPRLKVGATPTASDADALAYLLTGQSLSQAGEGGKFDVYAAALSLGIDKGSPQLAAVRRELGLDELGVQAGASAQDTAIKLGKYLNPDLFVGYSLNVFDNTGAVLARLRLADGLSLEGRSALTHSIDLIYRIESD